MGSADYSLPIASSHSGRKNRVFLASQPQLSSVGALETLRGRARLTNLAVVLLVSGLLLSSLVNIGFILSPNATSDTGLRPFSHDLPDGRGDDIPKSIEATILRDPRAATIGHLVMVPGHAIWHGHERESILDESEWILDAIQRGGSIKTFVKHIEEGIRIAKEDSESLLVFSGGQTRQPPSPLLSEAQSYLFIAQTLGLVAPIPQPLIASESLPLASRITTEEFALDSYQNLLFAIARFQEFTGKYPRRITVVGYGMKRARFVDLHRAVLRFPEEDFTYVGIDDEGDTTASYAGELKYGYTPFVTIPSGCHPPLSVKRLTRNPFHRFHPYHISCPELRNLFEWCPPPGEGVYSGPVPWAEQQSPGHGEAKWGRERE